MVLLSIKRCRLANSRLLAGLLCGQFDKGKGDSCSYNRDVLQHSDTRSITISCGVIGNPQLQWLSWQLQLWCLLLRAQQQWHRRPLKVVCFVVKVPCAELRAIAAVAAVLHLALQVAQAPNTNADSLGCCYRMQGGVQHTQRCHPHVGPSIPPRAHTRVGPSHKLPCDHPTDTCTTYRALPASRQSSNVPAHKGGAPLPRARGLGFEPNALSGACWHADGLSWCVPCAWPRQHAGPRRHSYRTSWSCVGSSCSVVCRRHDLHSLSHFASS
jgi:hypothetical protein